MMTLGSDLGSRLLIMRVTVWVQRKEAVNTVFGLRSGSVRRPDFNIENDRSTE